MSTCTMPGAVIPLSNRDFFCLVSAEDYEWLCRFSWFAKDSRWGEYACTSVRGGGKVHTYRMHRLILRCFDERTVDHLNKNHFDNRQDNLEIVSNIKNVKRYRAGHCEVDAIPF